MKPGDLVRAYVRGEPIIFQEILKEKEEKGMSGRYRHQGGPVIFVLSDDTGKLPASVYCNHFLNKRGNLSLLGGICTMHSI